MLKKYVIQEAKLVNEGKVFTASVKIEGEKIVQISAERLIDKDAQVIEAKGLYLFPGVIDAQVHFRDPGLTHKADLNSESKAAVAGGVTAFVDMPNTVPNALTPELIEEKNRLASEKSLANYCFFMGINNDNVDEVMAMDTAKFPCLTDDGLYFTKKGNLLADSPQILEKIFSQSKTITAIHSELEAIIEVNEEKYRAQYGEDVPVELHPIIRSEAACYESTKRAVALAEKHQARLHILHLSTAKETEFFRNDIPLEEKKITTEVSVHHLWFSDADYARLGKKIKWNPAIKTAKDKAGLLQALLEDKIDIITTDHAPHAWDEKDKPYFSSMSGAPLIQHSLVALLEFYHQGKISLEKIIEKMCHNVAILYGIKQRGFIREGYQADLTLVDLNQPWTVDKSNILYKCGWSPMEGQTFQSKVLHTFVNGHPVYQLGKFDESVKGQALRFNCED